MVLVTSEIFFFNRMALLVTISRHIKFSTVQYLRKSTIGNIYQYLEKISGVYYRRWMYVEILYMDREFENPRRIIPGRSTLNTTAAGEHVPEIEQQIRVIKERARDIWSTLLFNKFPGRIIIEIILFVEFVCVTWMSYQKRIL